MKKVIALILIVVMILSFSACGNSGAKADIVCVDYLSYDWISSMIGESTNSIEIALINDEGVDNHSFQPSVDDIVKIKSAKMVVYLGGESEKWVNDILFECMKDEDNYTTFINLNDFFVSSTVFRAYDDNDDEHIWSSLTFASGAISTLIRAIEQICFSDNNFKGRDDFEASAENYIAEIEKLADAYANLNPKKPIVLADRNPFNYLLQDAGVTCYAAFDGCSAETEASFETIKELATVVDENNLDTVLYIDNFTEETPELCQSVINASKNKDGIITDKLLSMDSALSGDCVTYLDVMWNNYYVLANATGGKTVVE